MLEELPLTGQRRLTGVMVHTGVLSYHWSAPAVGRTKSTIPAVKREATQRIQRFFNQPNPRDNHKLVFKQGICYPQTTLGFKHGQLVNLLAVGQRGKLTIIEEFRMQ